MKKILVIAGALALFAACGKKTTNDVAGEYTVTGEAKEIADGTKIYLDLIDPATGGFVVKDSTDVKSNAFLFKGNVEYPDLAFVYLKGEQGRIPLILEAGDIKLVYNKSDLATSHASGTTNNDLFTEYNKKNEELTKQMLTYQGANQEAYMKAMQANDEAAIKTITGPYEVMQENKDKYIKEFTEKNAKSFVALILFTNVMQSGELEKDEIVASFNKFDEAYKKSSIAKAIKTMIDQIPDSPVKVGLKAPEFSAKSPDGKEISLKESLGKVTLIDFWASWCGPCREENPNVVAMYKKYHDKGFNIIGVSLDKDANKWKQAIAQDQLTWNQISNLQHWEEPIAKLYGVTSIPATFLVDANGVVIAKNLRGEKLEEKLKEVLK